MTSNNKKLNTEINEIDGQTKLMFSCEKQENKLILSNISKNLSKNIEEKNLIDNFKQMKNNTNSNKKSEVIDKKSSIELNLDQDVKDNKEKQKVLENKKCDKNTSILINIQNDNIDLEKNDFKLIKKNVLENNSNLPSIKGSLSQITTNNTNKILDSKVSLNNTNNKSLSAWKRTKILSKTLSSIEVIKVMKNKTSSQNNAQNLKVVENNLTKISKSSSGSLNTDQNHLLTPAFQNKRRSEEDALKLNINSNIKSNSLTSSCNVSIQNLNDAKQNIHTTNLQAALNNLNRSNQIPNNHNTNLINQLNKNYLKNIQKQNKARSDWKSLKSKLINLAKKDNEENIDQNTKHENTDQQTNLPINNQLVSKKLTSNSQIDDGIICKKEDLLFILRNSTLLNKQRAKGKQSLADVVVQLQEQRSRRKNSIDSKNELSPSKKKNQTKTENQEFSNQSNDSEVNNPENNQSKEVKLENSDKLKKNKNNQTGNRVQFILKKEDDKVPDQKLIPTSSTDTKKKSSLKKNITVSLTSNNNSTKQTKLNTINNTILNKKKVKILETDQNGIRKALMLDNVNNNSSNCENNEKLLNLKDELHENEYENEDLKEKQINKVKWDETNVVDADLFGDAIQAFLQNIGTKKESNNLPLSTVNKTRSSNVEKKVSFKK